MNETTCKTIDPRVRRTRQLLQAALSKLLEQKEFEKISIQDIADAATLNRATFYDHYDDKFALLECMVASRFHELLAERGVRFDGSCAGGLGAMVLGVCDFLMKSPGAEDEHQRLMVPHLESAAVAVVRKMILDGLKMHPGLNAVSPEMMASTVSSAVFGAAKEWVRTPNRCSLEEIVETVTRLVTPIFGPVSSGGVFGE
jgi:AcrR family transcriptional regulator